MLGLSRISERYPVSVREQIFGMVVERALTEVFSARAADFEALVVGCSHGRGIDLDRMGFVGVNLSMPWLDLFEIDYQLRALLPRLPKVRTVFIAVPYFAFSWDNSLIRDSQLLISRRLFYYHAPFFSFMPGDYENFIKGKLWRLLRPDHWEHVILLTKPVVVTGESGEIIEAILAGALINKASDVHFEPEKDKIRIRLRLDGVLEDIIFMPATIYQLVLNRVKLLSGLKLNIHEKAQDGRFSIISDNAIVEIRTSVLPGAYGENIVMRVLDPSMIKIDLEKL